MVPFSNNQQPSYGDDDAAMAGLVGYPLDDGNEYTATPVPLLGVSIKAHVLDFLAEVKLSQCYQNTQTTPIAAIYHFPVDQAAAVCGFQAEYEDGTIVKGVVKEKQLARQEFQHAVQQGKQANLLEAVRRDVFTLNVGNIPASGYVKITITYVTSLQAREDAAAFVLPMYIAPRYTPQGGMPSEEQGLTVRNQSNVMLFVLDIAIEFTSRSNIKGITTPTHAQEPSLSCDYQGKTGQFLLRDFTMDRDLVVLLEEEQCHQPRVVIEASEAGTLAGFVTLFPKLDFRDLKREFVFLIDRSGSMDDQNKMKQARETLLLFLRSLPVSCTFNIVGFGSRHSSLFHTPMPYNDETLESASTYAMGMLADFGGTEISAPLEYIFDRPCPAGAERQVFVLTDGQVSNDLQVFNVIRKHCSGSSRSRLFSVGLGSGASRHLVEGMARAGRGTSRFVGDGSPGALQKTLLGQLKQALQPSMDNVSIEWNYPAKEQSGCAEQLLPAPVKTLLGYRSPAVDGSATDDVREPPKIFPSIIPPVHNREKFISFALFPVGSEMPTSVTVTCETHDGKLATTLDISEAEIFQGSIAHRMAARAAISEYEDHRTARSPYIPRSVIPEGSNIISEREALQLALTYSLVSEQTSFIVVRKSPAVTSGTGTEDEKTCELIGDCPAFSLDDKTAAMNGASKWSVANSRNCLCNNWSAASAAWKEADPLMNSLDERSFVAGNGALNLSSPLAGIRTLTAPAHLRLPGQETMLDNIVNMLKNTEHAESLAEKSDQPNEQALVFKKKSKGIKKQASGFSQGWSFGIKDRMTKWLNPDAIKADLGKDMQAFYDSDQKTWVFPGDSPEQVDKQPSCPPRTKIGLSPRKAVVPGSPLAAMMAPPQRKIGLPPEKTGATGSQLAPMMTLPPKQMLPPTFADKVSSTPKSSGPNLISLCLLQKANGSFVLDKSLVQAIGLTKEALEGLSAAARSDSDAVGTQPSLLPTALAVAAMRVLFAASKDLWELQEQKALQFMESLGLSPSEVTNVIGAIEPFLSGF